MSGLRHFALLVRLLIEDRQRLALENIALRHQLAVLKRSVTRPKIHDSDRMFWILMKRMLADWRDALHFVKPDTIGTFARPERSPLSAQRPIRWRKCVRASVRDLAERRWARYVRSERLLRRACSLSGTHRYRKLFP